MLSKRGNPSMDKLARIFRALCRELRVELSVQSGSAPRRPRRAA
jgi:DNA-binding phage protein